MINFRNKNQKGFTLMEILVYIAILTIILTSIIAFLFWALKSNQKTKAFREVSDNARRTMEIMLYEIKESKYIYAPTSNSTQLSLATLHYLLPQESISYIDFFLCDGPTVCLKKESVAPIALTSDSVEVFNLEFIQVSTSSVQINLSVKYKNPNSRPENEASIDLTSTVSLRSY
ncbi:MAG: prepilin-type N-terminal cleavage/methylation domain-containing protein [Candidatus Nealsonbacteria bacterium]